MCNLKNWICQLCLRRYIMLTLNNNEATNEQCGKIKTSKILLQKEFTFAHWTILLRYVCVTLKDLRWKPKSSNLAIKIMYQMLTRSVHCKVWQLLAKVPTWKCYTINITGCIDWKDIWNGFTAIFKSKICHINWVKNQPPFEQTFNDGKGQMTHFWRPNTSFWTS